MRMKERGGGGGVRAVCGTRQKEGWGSAQWQTRGRGEGNVRSTRQGTGAREQNTRSVWAGWLWSTGLAAREGNGQAEEE
jgi:hypothetical protein